MTRTGKLAFTLLAVIAACSFTLGALGLHWAGLLAGLPSTLAWGVPVIIDGGLCVFALAAAHRRSQRQPARFAWTALGLLTVASMGLQVAHVVETMPAGTPQMIGATVAASFPLLVFASTHVILEMAIAPAPPSRSAARRAQRTTTTPEPVTAPTATTEPVKAPAPTPTVTPAHGREVTIKRGSTPRPDDARILALIEAGLSQRAAAEQLGVSKSAVARAVERSARTGQVAA